MNLVTGAMGSLLPKMAELLKEEYKLPNTVKEGVWSLQKEMKSMHAALQKVAEVPRDDLDEQVKLWAGEVRELTFDMEDVVDKFLVRVDDDFETATKSNKLKRLTDKMACLFIKGKARHQIAKAIKDINKQLQEVATRRGRYTIENIVAKPAPMTPIDPRLAALYTEVAELVGIVGKRDQELMKLLLDGDSKSNKKLKIVSIVGFGGLGKTTLVKTVYDKIKEDFDCRAFVPVGRNADAKKVLMDILLDIGIYESQFTILDERQLIDKLRRSLENKKYLIVIDDLWVEKLWRVINWAFSSRNNSGSRLITTTRIVSVSILCCSSTNDSIYQMEPLSYDDSQRLFYKRIFSEEGICPNEFMKVSANILKKCGGVPLAIITIASILASGQQVKPVDEWSVLLESIGRGLTEDPSVEEMMRILSFSYYDLPSHLKTCLLYLGMFPEEYKIRKDRLIWMWIAESFVQCEKVDTSLFHIGETYFNELVNRNMILPIYDDEGIVVACNIHDMVLDLICSLSSEDNFLTILNRIGDGMSSQSNVRRLSLQNTRKAELRNTCLVSMSLLQVRTLATFRLAIDLVPSFSRFLVLRVLELKGCSIIEYNHLNLGDLGSLLHLRYLGLARTGISELPEEVGKLQFLQVLDLSENFGMKLPSTVIKMRRLMCLLIDHDHMSLPGGMGNMTSMEVVSEICGDSLSIVKELGSMERLRELKIRFDDQISLELEETLVESLRKMSNIQILRIHYTGRDGKLIDVMGERWEPPRSLREVGLTGGIQFSILPAWIRRNPSHLSQLSRLQINVEDVGQDDLDLLGRLPSLRILILWSECQNELLHIATDSFRCLTTFRFVCLSPGQVWFHPRAMPKAQRVELRVSLKVAKEQPSGNDRDLFDLGMGSLPSLGMADVTFFRSGVTVGEADKAEAALGNALRAHHNRPTFRISFLPRIPPDACHDDVYETDDEQDNWDDGQTISVEQDNFDEYEQEKLDD